MLKFIIKSLIKIPSPIKIVHVALAPSVARDRCPCLIGSQCCGFKPSGVSHNTVRCSSPGYMRRTPGLVSSHHQLTTNLQSYVANEADSRRLDERQ